MDAAPPVPRLAATLLVVRDDPFEVLMVRRHEKASFASALVFPGGVAEPVDSAEEWMPRTAGGLDAAERAIRITAIRETWEETGLLVAMTTATVTAMKKTTPPTTATATDTARDAAGRMPRTAPFRSVCGDLGAILQLADIHPFAHWITPEGQARRFDTRFFLARAPLGQEPFADGDETTGIEWVSPDAAVERTLAGDRSIIFPTLLNLMRLAESTDVESAIAAAAKRPAITVQPRSDRRSDGSTWITIPSDAGYVRTEYRAD